MPAKKNSHGGKPGGKKTKPKTVTLQPTAAGGNAGGTKGDTESYTVRVRMFRHGLGDCHLLTFPRQGREPFQLLIDFGALNRDAKHMRKFAVEIEEITRGDAGTGRLDLIVATHEHKDHLSGFNQARNVFERMAIGGVWMGWTEDPDDDDARELCRLMSDTGNQLKAALSSPRAQAAATAEVLTNVRHLLRFSDGDDTHLAGRKTIAEALKYLREKGKAASNIRYLEPGQGPLTLDGVEGVRVYVLGPPRDRDLLFGSEVTKDTQKDGIVYHLRREADVQLAASRAALSAALVSDANSNDEDSYHPFAREHRIYRAQTWWNSIKSYVDLTYDEPTEKWRQIDYDWLGSLDQLALKLANDTNNTSLVLAFEIVKSEEVLLFVGDAQVGNWQSWEKVSFKRPTAEGRVSGHDLLRRTVFYKVGHHASHNATLKKGGLELMQSPKLVAFIPLDKDTAAQQGRKDPKTKKPKGWQMPAKALYRALKERTGDRVVISDAKEPLSTAARAAGVKMTATYFEYTI